MKIGRNEKCPLCSSGKKYKKCCGDPRLQNYNDTTKGNNEPSSVDTGVSIKKDAAKELIRQQQQGLGKPIIEAKWKDHQFVAVGDTLYHSSKWRTFPDFLSEYLIMVLGTEWADKELKKTLEDQHIIMQWYHKQHVHLKKYLGEGGTPKPVPSIGVVYCYLGLAYNLYLLKHNVELQQIFVNRLKDINNFQGAYYELIIANCLIRSGFDLELENEQDESSKHCEFSALSKQTGKKFWVEAKSRAVVGVLGKDHHNGTTRSDPTGRLSKHLKGALQKPASDDRLIFIDVNTTCESDALPDWFTKAESKLKMREKDLEPDQSAYVFVTNICYHRHLDDERQCIAVLPYGLGILDFARNEPLSLSEIYRRKQKHIDTSNILDSFGSYTDFPVTFDGSLPSDKFNPNPNRVEIGKKYFFKELGGNGLVATVTEATVNEQEKQILIVTDSGHILTEPISENELKDYKKHPDAFFGAIHRQGRKADNIYDFFENIVEIHMSYSKESTLKHMEKWPNYNTIKDMKKEEIVLLYCESVAHYMNRDK